MLMFILVSVFTIATLITRKILPFTKEFLIHFIFMIIILIFLWILTQLIKWNLYKNITEKIWGNKSNIVKFLRNTYRNIKYLDSNWYIYFNIRNQLYRC